MTVAAPPDVLDVVSVTEATPLEFVRAVLAPPENAPYAASVSNVTTAFGTSAPRALRTVALIKALLLVEIDVTAEPDVGSVMVMVIVGLPVVVLPVPPELPLVPPEPVDGPSPAPPEPHPARTPSAAAKSSDAESLQNPRPEKFFVE